MVSSHERARASLQQLEIIGHATALKARTCFALDGVENKRAAERGRERGRQLFVQVDPGTRNRVYPAIDPPSTWESFEAEARRTPAFATVTEQLATVTVIAQSVTQSLSQDGKARRPRQTCHWHLFTRGACLPSKLRVGFHLHGSTRDDGRVDADVGNDVSHDKLGKGERTLWSTKPGIMLKQFKRPHLISLFVF